MGECSVLQLSARAGGENAERKLKLDVSSDTVENSNLRSSGAEIFSAPLVCLPSAWQTAEQKIPSQQEKAHGIRSVSHKYSGRGQETRLPGGPFKFDGDISRAGRGE